MIRGCDEVRLDLGAYALGALDAADGEEVRAHLESCRDCREELEALRGAARALGHLPAPEAVSADGQPPASDRLLGRTLAELARRRRRFRLRLAGAGVALALVAAGAATGLTLATHPGNPVLPATAHLVGADPGSGVEASADVYAESWGTSIHMTISRVDPGDRCELVAVARDGSEEVAGSWHVGYSGAAVIDGATGMSAGQLASLRVMTSDGRMLIALAMPLTSSS